MRCGDATKRSHSDVEIPQGPALIVGLCIVTAAGGDGIAANHEQGTTPC